MQSYNEEIDREPITYLYLPFAWASQQRMIAQNNYLLYHISQKSEGLLMPRLQEGLPTAKIARGDVHAQIASKDIKPAPRKSAK